MKQRIITGTIAGIVALLAILFLPTFVFAWVIFAIAMIGLFEWSRLLKLAIPVKAIYLVVGGITLLLVTVTMLIGAKESVDGLLVIYIQNHPLFYGLLALMAIFWLFMPFVLSIHARRPVAFLVNREFLFVASILTLAALMVTLVTLQQSVILLLYLILLVIIADSGAYFVGRKLGKHKLAPTISPGKSVEGAVGGIVLGILYAFVAVLWLSGGENPILMTANKTLLIVNFVSLSALVVIVSISGDLFESVVKRHAGVKDSGNILPGHGGILDRIDALTAAAPLFFVGLTFI
ncbi:phosphatidate cytidylyltransferase [Ignatzschineria larvae DSM 13226]|uniref:Phosphatidate cytidylyltransferase n=1 Tax=Ignatzschineria larvae DSM 13226 TaxID=1111732 RepID=A0ABZ3C066_9GAMM|nr:phosphatidate cytidylyltransferase [Ignatzschineria larvae]